MICYCCLKLAKTRARFHITPPLAGCNTCGCFTCDAHGVRDTQNSEFICVLCDTKLLTASALKDKLDYKSLKYAERLRDFEQNNQLFLNVSDYVFRRPRMRQFVVEAIGEQQEEESLKRILQEYNLLQDHTDRPYDSIQLLIIAIKLAKLYGIPTSMKPKEIWSNSDDMRPNDT